MAPLVGGSTTGALTGVLNSCHCPKSKSSHFLCLLTTQVERGGIHTVFHQEGNLYYLTAYARYIRCQLIHCKYTPINQYTSPTIESHLTTDFPTQKYAKLSEQVQTDRLWQISTRQLRDNPY